MNRVFVIVTYEVFNIPNFFNSLYEFIGDFQIEQSIEQSLDNVFNIWFYTDKIKFNEGECRQIEVTCENKNNILYFKMSKIRMSYST